jgi:2-polyprenyl-3-methyl-5-hydroxy-6-metoxy-1,4-benzoquinol methylase
MPDDPHRQAAQELASQYLNRGDAIAWFDALYRQAKGQTAAIPWANLRPNPALARWLKTAQVPAKRALVIGCGLGDDAELLASQGYSVTAFDIAPEAIRWARQRFPNSKVDYRAADALHPPAEWTHQFDLVVEIYTLQALPEPLRMQAIPTIAATVAPNGQLFLYCRARDESDPPGQIPWPLTAREVRDFENHGLACQSFEDFLDNENPPIRRFQAIFHRPLS